MSPAGHWIGVLLWDLTLLLVPCVGTIIITSVPLHASNNKELLAGVAALFLVYSVRDPV